MSISQVDLLAFPHAPVPFLLARLVLPPRLRLIVTFLLMLHAQLLALCEFLGKRQCNHKEHQGQ